LADIFVSYSRLDHDRVKPIVDRLESLGYSVWWDKHLRTDEAFADEVEGELDRAKAALAVWSANAINSTWVCAEAARALDAGKCAHVRIDNVDLPQLFNGVDAADMSGGKSVWGPLEDRLARIVRNAAPPAGQTPRLGALATPAATGAPKLTAVALAAALAAFVGALSAAYDGVLSPDQLQLAATGVLAVGGLCAALSAYRLIAVTRAGG
jgi:hypothetical protein